jgi:hypothetical protein
MAIEGPLRELGLHDVFQLLDLSRKTGVMRVTSHLRNNEGLVAFEGGAIVYAEIRSNPLKIGELLVRTGRITPADLEQARTAQAREQGARRLGQVLVAQGALGQRELQRVVEQQVAETVFELLSWQEGHFSFSEEPLTGVPADVMVRIRTESVLMEGARRIDEWSRIETHVRHLGVVPLLAPAEDGGAAQLDLLPAEWEVLALVDGARSVREIAADLGRSEFDVARVLFGLASTGIVTLLDPGGERRPARPSAGGDAAALLATAETRLAAGETAGAREAAEAAVALAPGEVRAHVVLCRAHLEAGRTADAGEEGRRAVRLDPLHLDAHRWFGLALAAGGRFADAAEQFGMWERLAAAGAAPADREVVASVRAAAETFARMLGGNRG